MQKLLTDAYLLTGLRLRRDAAARMGESIIAQLANIADLARLKRMVRRAAKAANWQEILETT